MKKKIIFLLITLLGCTSQVDINQITNFRNQSNIIYLQPYEDFSEKEINEIIPELNKQFSYWFHRQWEFRILNSVSFSNVQIYNNKYEAKEILDFQLNEIKKDGTVVGLTHKDICADLHNTKHYGIIGLSYRSARTCIVSDKRVRNKSNFWKVILHEFMHAYYGAVHCPNDDSTCFMKDAKGKGNLGVQNKLCSSCNKYK